MHVFGLLHIAPGQKSAMNLSVNSFHDQLLTYTNNARVLSRSLELSGLGFTLLTNDKTTIESIVNESAGAPLEIVDIPFSTVVPSGTRFYSAHFKLDAFRHLASLPKGYHALCDLDMICINEIPCALRNIIKQEIPLYYDISDQVHSVFGQEVIIRDLSIMGSLESEGRWSGGEFIAGPPGFFCKLIDEIDTIYANYLANIDSLHHTSDEAFTSAALERLRRNGLYISEAGSLGVIGRYWNTHVLHPQRPYQYFQDLFLLHLPADKKFLASLAQRQVNSLSQLRWLYNRRQGSLSAKCKRRVRALRSCLKRSSSRDGK